jgi:hypothetical protein
MLLVSIINQLSGSKQLKTKKIIITLRQFIIFTGNIKIRLLSQITQANLRELYQSYSIHSSYSKPNPQ